MRTALRTATALLLPRVVSARPASASSTSLYREKGAFAEAYLEGVGTPAGLPGNYSIGYLTIHSSDLAEGFVETFTCDPGETPYGDQNGQNACDSAGAYPVWGEGLTVVTGKGKAASSTYSGSVDLYDATTEEGSLAAQGVPLSLTLAPTGGTAKSTFTDYFRDPENGFTYKYRETRVHNQAVVQGDVGGIPALDGSVGTYSTRSMEKVA